MSDRFLEFLEPSAEYLQAMALTKGYVEMGEALFYMSTEEFEDFLKSDDEKLWLALSGFLKNRIDPSNLSELGGELADSFARFRAMVSRPEMLRRLCADKGASEESDCSSAFKIVALKALSRSRSAEESDKALAIFLRAALSKDLIPISAMTFVCERSIKNGLFSVEGIGQVLAEGFKALAPFSETQAKSAFIALGQAGAVSYDGFYQDESEFLGWLGFGALITNGCPMPDTAQLALLAALAAPLTQSAQNQQRADLHHWFKGGGGVSPAVAQKACAIPTLPGWLKGEMEKIALNSSVAGPSHRATGARL